ncbi:MAG: sugar phosphate isomerase/epimerase family protein [Alphaproteobacteria bacterium]
MAPHDDLAINQATTRPQWSLAEAIDGYAKAGIRGIGIWPDKLAECGLAAARRLLGRTGLRVTSYCAGEMVVDRAGKPQNTDRNKRLIDEAAELGAVCLVCVVGGLPEGSLNLEAARMRAYDTLAALLPYARAAGVDLAIEPIHPMRAADVSCISTLAQANHICASLGAGAGIVVDAYHVWWDPQLAVELERARGRILLFQICDWLMATTTLANDRGMMGDGVIDLAGLHSLVRSAGFGGMCEVEIMSERNWWRRDPAEVVATCRSRFRSLLSQVGSLAPSPQAG